MSPRFYIEARELVRLGIARGLITPAPTIAKTPPPTSESRSTRCRRLAIAKGICVDHPLRPVPPVPGKTRCAECLAKKREQDAKYRPRKKAQKAEAV